jgi:hypothetical protein
MANGYPSIWCRYHPGPENRSHHRDSRLPDKLPGERNSGEAPFERVLYNNWLRHNARFLERKIVAPATTSFLQAFVWGALIAFFPLYAIQCGIMNPGHFFSAIAIMMIAGRMLGGRIVDTHNKEKLF